MIISKNGEFAINVVPGKAYKSWQWVDYNEVVVACGKEQNYVYRQWFTDQDQLNAFVRELECGGYGKEYFRINHSWTPWIQGGCF